MNVGTGVPVAIAQRRAPTSSASSPTTHPSSLASMLATVQNYEWLVGRRYPEQTSRPPSPTPARDYGTSHLRFLGFPA
jgi:hypothetical protein